MALSRKDVILASLAAFVAWRSLISWLPVLQHVTYAFLFGALTTVLAFAALIVSTSRSRKHVRDGHRYKRPAPHFLAATTWQTEPARFLRARTHQPVQLYPSSLVISDALDSLLNLAIRDFVSSWYGNITKDPTFPSEVDRAIRAALENIRDRLLSEDWVNVAVSRILPIITAHLSEFDHAERIIRGKTLNRNVTESEELNLAIAGKYRDGKLHPAASLAFSDTKLVQQEHLRKILVRILPDLLPESLLKSRAVSVLIKEIVACAVLFPVMQMVSDPDTWNQLMEAYGRTALQDRKTVRKLRAALDEHASPPRKLEQSQAFPRLAPHDSERAFERFVRAVRRTNNLSDARMFRSQVASQLKRESMVDGQDQNYLLRLETGKRVLDQKVNKLALVGGGVPPVLTVQPDLRNGSQPKARELPLVEVMHNAAGLSYFMEYMDRQRLMPLVQFWVVVDGFRNPLEDDFGDDTSASDISSWTHADRTDIAQISEAYMGRPELKVHQESQTAIRDFLKAGSKATSAQYRSARTAILSTQSAALEEMEEKYYSAFKKSDLYYKFLNSEGASILAAPPPEQPRVSEHPQVGSIRPLSQPPSMVRADSHPVNKTKDFRRTATSSMLKRSSSSSNLFDDAFSAGKSTDTDASAPLFDDGYDTEPLASSTWSLGKDSQNGDAASQKEIIKSMEAALNDIITEDPKDDVLEEPRDSLFGSPASSHKSTRLFESDRTSSDFQRIGTLPGEKVKPSLVTLGLVNTSSRIGVFSDDDLFPDEERFIEDEYADPEIPDQADEPEEEIHEAAPGDLGLTEAISALTRDIERLASQESVVDTLTRKAELTNNVAELRILGKSKSSLQREIRRKELQRQQYIVQESDNSLYGRSTVKIKSVMVGKESDGREFALYLVEVQRKAGEQMPAASWAVARRYSEFHDLHHRLRLYYPSTRNLEFPRRRMVMKLQKEFLHKRRVALEDYLRRLLLLPDVCRSRELRSFLSQQAILSHTDSNADSDAKDIVTRIYNSVTDGMDEFLGNVAVLDQLTTAGQNLISAATTQLNSEPTGIMSNDPQSIAEAEAELNAFEERELEPFVKPICDIFLETFDLNKGNNWLRGRAVVVVLHQLLGGTVERKVRDNVKSLVQEDSLLRHIEMIKDSMWPPAAATGAGSGDRKMREGQPPRTAAEKAKSRTEASVMLATLIPDLAANVVGRANAQGAARRIFATVNNERLNKHLAFTILDEVVGILFADGARGQIR